MSINNMVQPIADVLQMSLVYDKSNRCLQGNERRVIETTPVKDQPSCLLSLPLKVVASYYSKAKSTAGVLVHCGGDLYIAVLHDYELSRLQLVMVDGSAIDGMCLESCTMFHRVYSSKQALKQLGSSVVSTWYKNTNILGWST